MIDIKNETERLTKRFIAQLEAIGAQMTAETKAVSWSMVAEVIAAGLHAVAVGSLTWEDRTSVKRARLTAPVTKDKPRPVTKYKPRKQLSPSSYNAPPKVVIQGPKPTERAERFRDLLERGIGRWARRDGKVQYACHGPRKPASGSSVFYRMVRTDNGEEKDVKFASIVSDWIYINA